MKPTKTFLLYVLLIVIIQLCVTYYVISRTHNPNIKTAPHLHSLNHHSDNIL